MVRAVLLCLCLASACGGRDGASDSPAAKLLADKRWNQDEWFEAAALVEGYATRRDLKDGAGRELFDRLVRSDAWADIDFQRDGKRVIEAFPVLKRVVVALTVTEANDDLIALHLYSIESLYRGFLAAGSRFVAELPPGDRSRQNRLDGMDQMRLGLAMTITELLYLSLQASDAARTKLYAWLQDDATPRDHTDVGLQLVVATLDEYFLGARAAKFVPELRRIREAFAAELARRPAPSSGERVTYQGMPPRPAMAMLYSPRVSTTGGFAVDAPPGMLAKRIERSRPDGAIAQEHWVTGQLGDVAVEALCANTRTVDELVAIFSNAQGVRVLPQDDLGHWFEIERNGNRGRLRVTTIGDLTCMASVEGPPAQIPSGLAESFTRSLRAAPTPE